MATRVPRERDAHLLADGFGYAEGIRWRQDSIWLSDITRHRVMRCGLDGTADIVLDLSIAGRDQPRLGPSGLGFLPDGTLLIAMMSESGPWRGMVLAYDGRAVRVHADLRNVISGRLNDMFVAADGHAYVGALDDGMIVHVDPEGTARIALRDVRFPNGMALADEGSTLLFVGDGAYIYAADVGFDRLLGSRRVWADLTVEAAVRRQLVSGAVGPVNWEDLVAVGGADDIVLDEGGGIWVGTAGGEKFLRLTEGGFVTDVVPTRGRFAIACTLGGERGTTLLMTTASLVEGSNRTGGIGSPTLVRQLMTGQTTSAVEACDVDLGAAR